MASCKSNYHQKIYCIIQSPVFEVKCRITHTHPRTHLWGFSARRDNRADRALCYRMQPEKKLPHNQIYDCQESGGKKNPANVRFTVKRNGQSVRQWQRECCCSDDLQMGMVYSGQDGSSLWLINMCVFQSTSFSPFYFLIPVLKP